MVFSLQTQGLTALEGALGIRFDVSPAWKFYVEVLGVLVAEFQECSGLSMEREIEEVKEGGTNDFVWLLPKHIKHSTIVLKKGVTYNRELWRWFRAGQFDGQVWGFSTIPGASMAISLLKRAGIIVPMGTSVSIVLGTVDGKVAKHWDLIGAIPVKWTGPDMKSDSNEAALETLEIRHQGIDLSLEMMTPMAGFFGGHKGDDLSSTPPGEGDPNNYWKLQTGGQTETHNWKANDFAKVTSQAGEAGAPDVIPNPENKDEHQDLTSAAWKEPTDDFWNMKVDYTGDKPDEEEGSDFWDMPNLGS